VLLLAKGFDFICPRLKDAEIQTAVIPPEPNKNEATSHGCCRRTRIAIACHALQRGYTLELPLRTRLPNESPTKPSYNKLALVMSAKLEPPMLQILSGHEDDSMAEVNITASGPAECPPGSPHRIKLSGVGGGTRDIPQINWSWPAPALLDASLMETLDEDLLSLLHPFKMPELPAQVWRFSVPGCPSAKFQATIAAFPNVRWGGRLTLRTTPPPEQGSSGPALEITGDLGCTYDGRFFPVTDKQQVRALCRWTECLDAMARAVTMVMSLCPGPRYAALRNDKLARRDALHFDPWPNLLLGIDAELFEQEGNGLLGHALRWFVLARPFLAGQGEAALIGPWLEQPEKKALLAPLLAALDPRDAASIAREVGIFLVAEGQLKLRAGIEARRPISPTQGRARASGMVKTYLEARSVRDYDSFVIHQGAASDATARAGFRAICKPPAETPDSDPREHRCRAAVEFTGIAISSLVKSRPGCRFLPLQDTPLADPSQPSTARHVLAPSRAWPGGSEPGQITEIPWCD
jgi:hypothetical protein